MRKPVLLAFLCWLGCTMLLRAQIDSVQIQDLKSRIQYFYSDLDRNDMSTNVLYDRTVPFSSILFFNGVYDTSISYKNWFQIYGELYNACYDTTLMPSAEIVDSNAWKKQLNDTVPLGLLFFDFDKLKHYAVDSGLVIFDTINGYYTDVSNRIENPYLQFTVFTLSSLKEYLYEDKTYTFYIGGEGYYYTNRSGAISNVRIDFGDGAGWRTVSLGNYVDISYTATGIKTIIFELTQGGTTYRSKMDLPVRQKKVDAQDLVRDIQATIPWPLTGPNNKVATGRVTRRSPKDINNVQRTCVTRPVIILDGVDFGRWGCHKTENRCGDLGWADLTDETITDYDEKGRKPIKLMYQFINELVNDNDYDVFFLDFAEGADNIQRNAMLLVRLIEDINNAYNATQNPNGKCGCEEIVVMGPSMGGLVSKYALAYMEKMNMQHGVRMYVSLDAPQQGANIPIGAQDMIKYFAKAQPKTAGQALKHKLNTPAARQLLVYHHEVSGYYPTAHQERADFLNDLSLLGNYPSLLRRVAVSNGSKTGSIRFEPRDKMIEYEWSGTLAQLSCATIGIGALWLVPAAIDAHVWSVPGATYFENNYGGNTKLYNPVFYGDIPAALESWHTVSDNTKAYDGAPGSGNDALTDFRKKASYRCGPMTITNGEMFVNHDAFSFIPSVSSLDLYPSIGSPNLTNTGVTEALTYSVTGNSILDYEPARNKHPFDAFYAPDNNQDHVQIEIGSGTNSRWVVDQINANTNILETNLPTSGGTPKLTFNFGDTRNVLHSVNINSSGKLQVNGQYPTDYGAPSQDAVSGSTYMVRTSRCPATINVATGGELVVGDNNAAYPNNNKGLLIITSGSQLNLNGGNLIIHDGSTLIIEKGATLIFNSGSQIELLGNNAILEIRGTLHIGNNATFNIYNHNATSGFVRFHNEYDPVNNWRNITAGTNAQFALTSTIFSKILEVTGGEYIYPDDNLQLFKIEMARVELGDGCRLNIGCPLYLNNVHIYSINNVSIGTNGYTGHRGLHIYGQYDGFFQTTATITNTEFKNGKYGIFAPLFYGATGPVLNNSKFTNCDIGLYTDGRFINLENCTFTNCITGAWEGVSHVGTSIFNENKIHRTSQTISGDYGIYYTNSTSGVNKLKVQHSYIRDYNVGLASTNGILELEKSKIVNNTKGLSTSGTDIDANGPNNNDGYNDLSGNGTAIYMMHSSRININNGKNNLTPNTNGKCIDGVLDCTAPTSVSADYNTWSTGNGSIQAGTNTLAKICLGPPITTSGISINATQFISSADFATNFQLYYNGPSRPVVIKEDIIAQKSVKDSALEKVSDLLDSAKSALDLGAYEKGIGLTSKSIKRIIKEKPNKEAIVEIYDDLLQTLNNLITYEKIRPYRKDENSIFDSVANLQNTVLKFIKNEDKTLRFKISLEKAGLYVATNRQKEALKVFTEMSAWADTSRLYEISYFSCLAAAEDSVLSGVTPREEFARLIKSCSNFSHKDFTQRTSATDFNTLITEDNLHNNQVNERIELYPNPVQNIVNIKFYSGNRPNGGVVIELYDVTGKQVQIYKANNVNTNNGIYSLTVNDLPAGMYMINLREGNKNYKHKFIISK